jgi:hypothetical protein
MPHSPELIANIRRLVEVDYPPELALRLTIDDAVLTLDEWRLVNNFSPRTAQRILHGPNPPIITKLSAQRRGITVANNRAWQRARAS